jgi:hypothetical protein
MAPRYHEWHHNVAIWSSALAEIDTPPAKGHGHSTEQATDGAYVMGVERPPTHIIENRGTELAIHQLWKADEDFLVR